MRLSHLQIKGFKSFADETIINFGEQVIGVVGPNGSGKSNIVDAIKWVLGEQKTKELRLESMQDVIFNGTKKRKEGKVARVTVSFKNTKNILPTEYNDVSISRLLYRNGQSEYRLNDVQCRRKDITSLFLDSGLGSNAYAIISLSMVEDILVDRENSRGRMIEEASGINKYKVRKRETLLKLKGTQNDLDRVEDLLFELEANLKSFEKQARRTERYLEVKEKFKLVSLSWATRSVQQLNKDISELTSKVNQEQTRETELIANLTKKEAELQKVKQTVLEKEGMLSEFQRKHNQLKDSISGLENKKGIAQNELNYLNLDLKNSNKQSEVLSGEISRLEKERVSQNEQKTNQTNAINLLKEDYDGKLKAYNNIKEVYDTLRENLVSGQREKKEFSEKIEKTKRDISVKQSQINLLQEQFHSKETDEKEINIKVAELNQRLETFDEKYNAHKENLVKKQDALNTLNSQKVDSEQNINTKREELRKVVLKLEKVKQRIDLLENVINNYEGFTESIQYLNSENKIDNSLLSDVIEITDPQYQEIAEMYFSPYLQHVVVEDSNHAFSLNELVRKAQKGKINFFISDKVKAADNRQLGNQFIPLKSILSFEKQKENIIDALCTSVYIYQGSFNELLAENISDDIIVLLPQEQLVYGRGELKGGSVTLFEGVNIGRRQNLNKLKEQKDKLEASHQKQTNDINQDRVRLDKIISDIEVINQESRTLDYTIKNLTNERNQISNSISVQNRLKEEIQQKNEASKIHIGNIKIELDALVKLSESFDSKSPEEDKIEEMRSDFDKYHIEFEKARELRDKINQQILEETNKLNLLNQELRQTTQSLEEKKNILQTNDQNKLKNGEKIQLLKLNLQQIEEKVVDLYKNEKAQFQTLNSKEEEYFTAKSGIFDQEKDIYELRGKKDKVTHLLNSLKEKNTEKKQQLTSWKDRVDVEFHENVNTYQVPEEYQEVELIKLKDQRDNLQVKLKSFGDINPMAIEAYNEIKLRVEKITAERDDILEAKINLEETIDDIEKTASALFTDSLDKIRGHFKDVFRSLFSEDDDCDIVMLNADKPLESSIEIIAKPKGKKPKSINQLSGGEKTLTAVSFLFALYLLKPAPFCIFDEVDAPLDDLNIQKFNNIIRTFSKDSQFIIVTHNKSTMAEMDILYGVFMQEQGVSQVAAVDFREFNKVDLFAKK